MREWGQWVLALAVVIVAGCTFLEIASSREDPPVIGEIVVLSEEKEPGPDFASDEWKCTEQPSQHGPNFVWVRCELRIPDMPAVGAMEIRDIRSGKVILRGWGIVEYAPDKWSYRNVQVALFKNRSWVVGRAGETYEAYEINIKGVVFVRFAVITEDNRIIERFIEK